MNRGTILTPVAKGYNSKDYLNTEVTAEKVRMGALSLGNMTRYYSNGATTYIKRNPVKVGLITLGILLLATAVIYRSKIADQQRSWT